MLDFLLHALAAILFVWACGSILLFLARLNKPFKYPSPKNTKLEEKEK